MIATTKARALWWAERGALVLPLHYPAGRYCSCGQPSCSNVGKHPLSFLVKKGLNDASADPGVIARWWAEYPEANIGVRTGMTFDVVDLDGPDAQAIYEAMVATYGAPEHLGTVSTGREGGRHVYVAPGGLKSLAGGKTAPAGIDVKGVGGYVVAPGSLHASGRSYEWEDCWLDSGEVQGTVPWAEFHGLLVPEHESRKTLAPKPVAGGTGGDILARCEAVVLATTPGSRWQTLATEAVPLAARAIAGGSVDRDTAIVVLEDAARAVGLGEAEVRRIPYEVDRMISRGITSPIKPLTPFLIPAQRAGAQSGGPPIPDPAMFVGILGEIVAAADPHTEADPVGVLATLLAGVGVLVGPHVTYHVGPTRHPLLVWALLFGDTSTGRKGEAKNVATMFLRQACPDEYGRLATTGLSSGEGLIERVRDPITDDPRADRTTEDRLRDNAEKKLFVVEPEFAGTMARARREGSTLAAVLREAWDGGALAVLNRQELRASSSHIGIVGHITPKEFRIRFAEADMSGGTYNRFLPVYVMRSKRLAIPVEMNEGVVSLLAGRLGAAIDAARGIRQVRLGEEAATWWTEEVYDEVSGTDDAEDAAAVFVQRAAPYTLRLAALFAVLDGRNLIASIDLAAALALVRYSVASARFVLSATEGNSRLDRIRREIDKSPNGLSRSEVSALFSRNLTAKVLDSLLAELLGSREYEEVTGDSSGGRPAQRYRRTTFVVS